MFWVFKLSFVVDILAFLTWQLSGLLFKKFGKFLFSSSGHSGRLLPGPFLFRRETQPQFHHWQTRQAGAKVIKLFLLCHWCSGTNTLTYWSRQIFQAYSNI
jgi:hypothetical protein